MTTKCFVYPVVDIAEVSESSMRSSNSGQRAYPVEVIAKVSESSTRSSHCRGRGGIV